MQLKEAVRVLDDVAEGVFRDEVVALLDVGLVDQLEDGVVHRLVEGEEVVLEVVLVDEVGLQPVGVLLHDFLLEVRQLGLLTLVLRLLWDEGCRQFTVIKYFAKLYLKK